MTVSDVLAYLHNYFPVVEKAESGTFTVESGAIPLNCVCNGQFYLIEGSIFNDGVHQHPADYLIDETFDGYIVPLAVPAELVMIVEEMNEWEQKNNTLSPFQSESFGGYSYTRATGAEGQTATAFDVFASRLRRWKKV